MPKLTLKVTHTHAGAVYRAGDVIEADEVTTRWLIDHGIAQATVAAPVEKPAKPGKPVKEEE